MKQNTLLIALGSISATAFGGTAEPMMAAPAPAPEPSLCNWFVGGTFGQLDDVDSNLDSIGNIDGFDVSDLDFNMYTLHVGRGLSSTNGWDIAAFLEVGFLEGDFTISRTLFSSFLDPVTDRAEFDVDIIPVTANIMVERSIFGPVSAYLTGGAGYAWTEVSGAEDETDGGFYAQASAGLIYNITSSFEVYGGGRFLYLSDLEFGESEIELDDSFAWEIGARVSF